MKKLTNSPGLPLLGQTNGSTKRTDFLTVADWANRLQVSKRTIFRMLDEKIIPPYDIAFGKTRRWHEQTYQRWISDNARGN
jgi:excisionase family DNA binding protein